jgi:hypothetical protein
VLSGKLRKIGWINRMREEWKRGLIRLWLVASVCWIGFAGYSRYDGIVEARQPDTICPKLQRENEQAGHQIYDLEICHQSVADQKAGTINSGLRFVFAPPVLALAIGMATWWALKGFRRA